MLSVCCRIIWPLFRRCQTIFFELGKKITIFLQTPCLDETIWRRHYGKKIHRVLYFAKQKTVKERIPKFPPPRWRHGAKIEWRQPVGHIFIRLFFVCAQMYDGGFVTSMYLGMCTRAVNETRTMYYCT